MIKNTSIQNKLAWIKKMNPLTTKAILRYKKNNYKGIKLGYVAHVEPKIVAHLEFFINNGAEVYVAPCVPGICDPDTYEYLNSIGAKVYGINATNWDELKKAWNEILEQQPNYLLDIGGGLITEAVKKNVPIIAASEATSTGISNIKKLDLTFPVFDWNNISIKNLMHNRYEVGSGVWFAFRNLTGLDLCRMNVCVLGFGLVGHSVASIARGLGARVYVCDPDPIKQLVAASEGYVTGELPAIIKEMDVIATATGKQNILSIEDLKNAKDGLIVLNAGHDNREINLEGSFLKTEILPKVFSYKNGSKELYLLADGLLLNLAGGGGSAINTFDLTTALMVEIINHTLTRGKDYPKGLHPAPKELEQNILEK